MANEKKAVEANDATAGTGFHLLVTHAFGIYSKGDEIRDPAKMAAVLTGESARSVHKVLG
jgi:hypothetical protein